MNRFPAIWQLVARWLEPFVEGIVNMIDLPIHNMDYYNFSNISDEKRHGIYNVSYDYLGDIKFTIYYINGKIHREGGPAEKWSEYGKTYEFWFHHGIKHRLDGPAQINRDGTISYWIYGRKYFEKDYWTVAYIINNNLESYN